MSRIGLNVKSGVHSIYPYYLFRFVNFRQSDSLIQPLFIQEKIVGEIRSITAYGFALTK